MQNILMQNDSAHAEKKRINLASRPPPQMPSKNVYVGVATIYHIIFDFDGTSEMPCFIFCQLSIFSFFPTNEQVIQINPCRS